MQPFCLTYQKGLRAERAKQREEQKQLREFNSSRSKCVTPVPSTASSRPSTPRQASVTPVGEQLETNLQVHELPSVVDAPSQSSETEVLANTANFHSVSGGGGGPGSATFSPEFTRDIP